ncbi:hypothetical protein B0H16DRAFT_1877545 [Mycena metata]|uniref:Cyclin N-terminal domain-containing protein n=1 Tax=Mycena metata TaxID=1033252 RepID=A0AAD7KEM1_9AGAR|nr:hypothetical protein B0H16DRAFT_1877545 [Mycena metata]
MQHTYQQSQKARHKRPLPDPLFGCGHIAGICTRFITHLYQGPAFPRRSARTNYHLTYFIAFALHFANLHEAVLYSALALLLRLKDKFPEARGSSGHRLFLAAFMISSKCLYDVCYSNLGWYRLAQQIYSLREINQMERELCRHLEWELTVKKHTLMNLKAALVRDFAPKNKGPKPRYTMDMFSTDALHHTKTRHHVGASEGVPH